MDDKPYLLDCPFCGKQPRYVTGCYVDNHGNDWPFAECDPCHVGSPVEFWNTRAPAEDVRAVVEEPVYQVCNGVDGWVDVDRLRYTACQLDPEEYLTRVLFVRPQRPVVLPERDMIRTKHPIRLDGSELEQVWNACLDAVEELNK